MPKRRFMSANRSILNAGARLPYTALAHATNRNPLKIEFKEEQKFTQWWLWLILIGIGLIPIIGIYRQLVKGEVFGNNPMSDSGLIFFALCTFGLLILFRFVRLKTEIDQREIRMRFTPFTRRQVKWSDVQSAQVVNYGFVGGWGIRLWTKYGTVYTTKGNKGLAIRLKNGKKFLIGTQKESELNKIIKKMPVANTDIAS